MRTIIAGTDFSASSANACKYAALLAQRLKCKLVLFNLFEAPVVHSNIGLYGFFHESLKRTADHTKRTAFSTKVPVLSIHE
jgi:hypothetical protein